MHRGHTGGDGQGEGSRPDGADRRRTVLDTGKDSGYERSRLYAPEFDTMFRNGSGKEGK